jgi:hypothetical protein
VALILACSQFPNESSILQFVIRLKCFTTLVCTLVPAFLLLAIWRQKSFIFRIDCRVSGKLKEASEFRRQNFPIVLWKSARCSFN